MFGGPQLAPVSRCENTSYQVTATVVPESGMVVWLSAAAEIKVLFERQILLWLLSMVKSGAPKLVSTDVVSDKSC